jgi:hypothetical protein
LLQLDNGRSVGDLELESYFAAIQHLNAERKNFGSLLCAGAASGHDTVMLLSRVMNYQIAGWRQMI